MMDHEENLPLVESVCGGSLTDPSKYPAAQYRGKTVYFCTEACRQAFLGDPDRFMAGEIDHPAD